MRPLITTSSGTCWAVSNVSFGLKPTLRMTHVVSYAGRAGTVVASKMIYGSHYFRSALELRTDAFVADYLTATEQAVVATAHDADERNRLANLIWSAKESALKVLKTGLRRDTRSVDVQHEKAQPTAWGRLRIRSEEGAAFPGWWRQYGQFVLTIVAATELPPPVSLQELPPLQDAMPTHAWLAAPLV